MPPEIQAAREFFQSTGYQTKRHRLPLRRPCVLEKQHLVQQPPKQMGTPVGIGFSVDCYCEVREERDAFPPCQFTPTRRPGRLGSRISTLLGASAGAAALGLPRRW